MWMRDKIGPVAPTDVVLIRLDARCTISPFSIATAEGKNEASYSNPNVKKFDITLPSNFWQLEKTLAHHRN